MLHCGKCDRWFVHDGALQQHIENSNVHNYCHRCQKDYQTVNGYNQQLRTSRAHASHDCSYCNDFFFSIEDYRSHLVDAHNWCQDCGRCFGNYRALINHRNSSIHTPKDKLCPLCKSESFSNISAIAAHVESGRCPAFIGGVNEVANVVRMWERQQGVQNLFTNKQIEYPGYNRVNPGSATPNNLRWTYCVQTNTYDCPICHREFSQTAQLSAHLNGRAHASANYHCHSCSNQFLQLTGLFQHLERTQCRHQRSDDVERLMSNIRRLGM
ncbi:hypothetical protein MP638_004279 [Amoeboaphelidium occidentale]|nr:hypothetical protein MP638_004279 [Amoeboaphelidium occidentale]